MEYGVLGELEPVRLGHLRQRLVLAVLLVELGRPVTADQLIDRVWGEQPPQRARETLYAYLSRLRGVVGDELSRQSGGYVLRADPESVDLHRFRRLVAAARDSESAALFEEALGLWRGEPFAGADTPWFNQQRSRLEAERLAAELDLTDLHLRYGEAQLPVLRSRAQTHPLDERVAGQLILALHRSGQTSAGLAEYDRIRRALIDELAIEPSARLQQLQRELLTTDEVRAPVPRQLPAAPPRFVGREPALKLLTAALATEESTIAISAVGGVGGIGKTALALHWAHRNLDRFPDGQLFVELNGFDPTQPPMPAERAIGVLLQALGAEQVPSDPQARVGLYRTMLADKRLLLILDNASDTAQVAPLLPGTSGCTVIITSRNRLGGLLTRHGAVPLDLEVLEPDDACELLRSQIGAERAASEVEAFGELLAHCAGLPLALAIVAARVAGRPDLPLSVLADELRDAEARLDAFDAGEADTGLRAVFDCSYRALDPEAARLLALLAHAPGADISTASAAELIGSNPRTALRRLEDASLLLQHVPGRYCLHDLVRLYACEQEVDEQALWRLADYYRQGAIEADRVLVPDRTPVTQERTSPVGLQSVTAATEWLDAEADNLLATQRLAADRGWYDIVWQIPWALVPYQTRRAQDEVAAEMWDRALTVVPNLGDLVARVYVHRFYGRSRAHIGRHDEALEHLELALGYAERSGQQPQRAAVLQSLTTANIDREDYERALEYGLAQLELYKTFDTPSWLADAYGVVAWIYTSLGRYDEARSAGLASLELNSRIDNTEGEADTLDTLSLAALQTGHFDEAVTRLEQALHIYRQVGNQRHEANSLDRLGDAHHALGHADEARAAWSAALTLYAAQRRTEPAAAVRDKLDGRELGVSRAH